MKGDAGRDVGVNFEMVKLARQARGLSQQELAELLDVPQPYLSQYESGIRDEMPFQLERLVEVLEFPLRFFRLMDPILDPSKSTNHYRKKARIGKRTLEMVHARINIARVRLTPLLREVEVSAPFVIKPYGSSEGEPYAPQDIEEIAALVRADWMLRPGPIDNLIACLENAGAIIAPIDFGEDDVDAVHHRVPGLPTIFFYNAQRPPDRIRFSLAHELGHVVLHSSSNEKMEEEANEFAASFLVPAEEFKNDCTGLRLDLRAFSMLKKKWKASMAMLIMRAKSIGIIDEYRSRYLFVELGRRGWRTEEPGLVDKEIPRTVTTIAAGIMSEFQTDSVGVARMAMCLGTKMDDVKFLFPENESSENIVRFPGS